MRWLLRERLLDELNLMICPIVLGRGARLFADWTDRLSVRLTDTATFSTGVLSLTYTPSDTNAPNRKARVAGDRPNRHARLTVEG